MLTIVTPVLNGEKFIKINIESIKALSIPYEHIIVDGGSTDNTLNIVQNYPELRVLNQTDKTGMYGAIHLGFLNASFDYICWINCDDYIISDLYEEFVKRVIIENCSFASSNGFLYFLESSKFKLVKSTYFLKFFLKKGLFPFSQPSVIYKRSLYFDVGGLDFNNFKICGDLDLFYRMAKVPSTKFNYYKINTTVFVKYGFSLGDLNSSKGYNEIMSKGILSENVFFYKILLKVFRMINL